MQTLLGPLERDLFECSPENNKKKQCFGEEVSFEFKLVVAQVNAT